METPGQKNLELAYLAGAFDGEGNVGIVERVHKKGSRPGQANDRIMFVPNINVTNTNYELLTKFRSVFEGSIKANKKYKEEHRDRWVWYISSAKKLREVLPLLLPYVSVKRRQMEILLELCTRMTGSTRILDDAELLLRRTYKNRIQELNNA